MDTNTTKLEQYERIQAMVQKEIATQFPALYRQEATKYGVASVPLHEHNGLDANKISQANIVPSLRASGSITMATDDTRYELGSSFNPTSVWFYGTAVRTNTTFTVTSANATAGAVYTNSGDTFIVMQTISGGTTLITGGDGASSSGTLTKQSGTGDATISFSSRTEAIGIRCHIVGNAQLGPTYYFQPQSSTSVKTGGPLQNVIQSSSALIIDSSVSVPVVRVIVSEGHLVSVEYPSGTVVARATIPTDTNIPQTSKGYGPGVVYVDVDLAAGWQIIGNFVVT